MPPKIIRIVNGEIREVEESAPQQQPRRTVVNGQASESDSDDGNGGPRAATDVVAQRLFGGGAPSSSSSSSPTFDFSKNPLAVAWEDRSRSLAGLPGLAIFGAHLSSRWLVVLAAATAAAGLKGLFISFAVWVLFKLGFEGAQEAAESGGHQLGAHPHSGALPARALASYLAAASAGRARATATPAAAEGSKSSDAVRDATRRAWAAREAAVAAAAKAAASAGKE